MQFIKIGKLKSGECFGTPFSMDTAHRLDMQFIKIGKRMVRLDLIALVQLADLGERPGVVVFLDTPGTKPNECLMFKHHTETREEAGHIFAEIELKLSSK